MLSRQDRRARFKDAGKQAAACTDFVRVEVAINNPASGFQTWDYNYFMGQYLTQTADRLLVYVE
jgi:hypothetical protein